MWILKTTRKYLFLSISTIASALFFSCSGGGGGEEIVSINSSSISGNVDINGISLISLPEGVTALVKIISVDKNGKVIDSKVQTTTSGFFMLNINTSDDGGKIIITASADGYTEGTKTIEYESPDDLQDLSIKLEIDPITQRIIPISQINITSIGDKVLRTGFFKDKNGVIKTVYGKNSIKKVSYENELIMELAIPISKLQEGVENIKVSYKDFKPSNPNDYKNFPGRETNDGKELISIGFDWLEITDPQTGKNPFVNSQPNSQEISVQLAKIDLGEYYRLLRYADCVQINKIKNTLGTLDEDLTKPGVQFTFYAFDQDIGAWIKAGQAIFVDSNDSNLVKYYELGENENSIDTAWDYIIQNGCINDTPCDPANPSSSACIDIDNDGNMEDISCFGNHVITDENDICTQGDGNYFDTYVVISVTNPEFNWKSIDYIKPGTNTLECKVVIKDDVENPIPTYVQAYASNNACIEWTFGNTSSSTGETVLSTLKYCEPSNGIIEYYDPINNKNVKYDRDGDGNPDLVTFCSPTDANCICKVDITIKNINKCVVEGYIRDSDTQQGKSNVFVNISNDDLTIYKWGLTDSTGKYIVEVPCGIELSLLADNTKRNFNVNGDIELDETADSKNIATLKDILVTNNPPKGYGWLSTYSTKKGNSVTAYLYAWDFENDFPVKYKLKVLDSSNQEISALSKTGTISQNYGQISETIDTTTLLPDNYIIKFVLADSLYTGDISTSSQKTVEILAGKLNVFSENAMPSISYFYVSPSIVGHVGETVNVYGSAYDLDGDNLTSELSYICYDKDNQNLITTNLVNGDDLLNNNFVNIKIPQNTDINKCEIKWMVSDGTNNVYKVRTVYIQNHPPIVSIWTDNQTVSNGTQNVNIYSNIVELDGDNYICSWFVNDKSTSNTDCNSFTLDLTKYTPPVEIKIKLVVTDIYGNRSNSILTIFFGKQTDLNISIQ